MDYTFKWRPEAAWVALTAVMTYAMTLTVTDFENITDWRKFAVALGVGLLRAVIGALLSMRGSSQPE